MRNKLKSYAVLFFTLLTLCAFVMPVFCAPAHAHSQSASAADKPECGMMSMKKADAGAKHQQGKAASHDGCCIGHHCCSVKLAAPLEWGISAMEISGVALHPHVDQFIPSFNGNSLERPPKTLG